MGGPNMKKFIINQLEESAKIKIASSKVLTEDIQKAAEIIINCFKSGNKVLIFGNGGSAADAQHIAGEFINKFRIDRDPLPAISLVTDTSVISSISNDSSYSYVFEKQIKALGKKGDVVIAITTSDFSTEINGHSSNMYYGLKAAKELGLITIGLVSIKSKNILNYLDISIKVPATDTPRIQETHLAVEHIICDLVEQKLFGNEE
jgi:D-sedoheptulose 7-phosphate isomerase